MRLQTVWKICILNTVVWITAQKILCCSGDQESPEVKTPPGRKTKQSVLSSHVYSLLPVYLHTCTVLDCTEVELACFRIKRTDMWMQCPSLPFSRSCVNYNPVCHCTVSFDPTRHSTIELFIDPCDPWPSPYSLWPPSTQSHSNYIAHTNTFIDTSIYASTQRPDSAYTDSIRTHLMLTINKKRPVFVVCLDLCVCVQTCFSGK